MFLLFCFVWTVFPVSGMCSCPELRVTVNNVQERKRRKTPISSCRERQWEKPVGDAEGKEIEYDTKKMGVWVCVCVCLPTGKWQSEEDCEGQAVDMLCYIFLRVSVSCEYGSPSNPWWYFGLMSHNQTNIPLCLLTWEITEETTSRAALILYTCKHLCMRVFAVQTYICIA